MTMTAVVSVGMGSMIASRIYTYFNMRNFLIYSLIVTTIGVLIKIVHLSFFNCLIGRIIHGLGAGSLSFVFGKAMNETIP